MDLQGKIIAALEPRSGTSARGEWKSQDFVVETHDQYPRKMVFSVFGADRLERFNIQVGQEVTVSFDIDAHEYNGRWFNNIRAFDVRVLDPNSVGVMGAGAPYVAPAQPASAATASAGPFPPPPPARRKGASDEPPCTAVAPNGATFAQKVVRFSQKVPVFFEKHGDFFASVGCRKREKAFFRPPNSDISPIGLTDIENNANFAVRRPVVAAQKCQKNFPISSRYETYLSPRAGGQPEFRRPIGANHRPKRLR